MQYIMRYNIKYNHLILNEFLPSFLRLERDDCLEALRYDVSVVALSVAK
jgi:hypothetical protein